MQRENHSVEESKYLIGFVSLFPVLGAAYMLILTIAMVSTN